MRQRRHFCSIGLGVSLAASSSFAREPQAESARISLAWAAPAECPERSQLVSEVEQLLGQSLASSQQALAVFVRVQGNPSQGYAGKLSFESSRGDDVRYLEHASCEQLAHGFALLIALAIDPERVRATQSARGTELAVTPPSHEELRVPAAAAEHAAPPPPASSPERNPDLPSAGHALRGARAALAALVGAGPLPGVGAGQQITLGLQLRRVRFDVIGRHWLAREVAADGLPNVKLDLGLTAIGLRSCWLPLSGAWQLAACGGADVGELRGDGSGVENPHMRRTRYSQLAAAMQAAYARWPLRPEFGVELSVPLERPPFGILRDGRDFPVFRPSFLGFSAFFGVAWEP